MLDSHRPDHQRTLIRSAVIPAAVAAVLAIAVGTLARGVPGLVGAVVGALLVVVFFGAGLWVVLATADLAPVVSMVAALGSYVGKVVLFGLALALLKDVETLDRTTFALAAVAVALVWMVGEVIGVARARTPLVDPAAARPAPAEQRSRDAAGER